MAGLSQLLQYLDRDGVDEIILQTGKAVTARVAGQLRPLGVAPVGAAQITAILAEPAFTTLTQQGQQERLTVGTRSYSATVMRRGDVVMIRLGTLPAEVARAPAPAARATVPAHQPSRTSTPSVVIPIPAAARPTPFAIPISQSGSAVPRPPSPEPVPPPSAPPARAPIEIPPADSAPFVTGPGSFGNAFPPPDAPPPPKPAAKPAAASTMLTAPPEFSRSSIPVMVPESLMENPFTVAPQPATPPTFALPQSSAATSSDLSPPSHLQPPVHAAAPAPAVAHIPAEAPATEEPLEALWARQPWTQGSFAPAFDPQLLEFFHRARQQSASDLHVVAERPAQARVVGELRALCEPLDGARVEAMLMPLLDARSAEQLQRLGYADLAFDVPGAGRVRANVNRQKTGLKGCFRLIVAQPPTLEQLGLPEDLAKVTKYHQGLAIVSGPSGHGKTTTLAALVDLINASKQTHIITVEDPVEIVHPMKRAVISQRQVGTHTNTFYAALKGALREDPDVIIIGELRDVETVEMALSAAETGHLVIATMSTPSGAKTIDRLIDMFPPENQSQVRATLAGALKIIVSQRLLPSADGTRMVAAAELITGSFPLWNLIRDDKLFQLPSLLQRGRSFGMIRIEDSLRQLVDSRQITMEAAMRVASDPKALQGGVSYAMPAGFKPKNPAPAPAEEKKPIRPPLNRGS